MIANLTEKQRHMIYTGSKALSGLLAAALAVGAISNVQFDQFSKIAAAVSVLLIGSGSTVAGRVLKSQTAVPADERAIAAYQEVTQQRKDAQSAELRVLETITGTAATVAPAVVSAGVDLAGDLIAAVRARTA